MICYRAELRISHAAKINTGYIYGTEDCDIVKYLKELIYSWFNCYKSYISVLLGALWIRVDTVYQFDIIALLVILQRRWLSASQNERDFKCAPISGLPLFLPLQSAFSV